MIALRRDPKRATIPALVPTHDPHGPDADRPLSLVAVGSRVVVTRILGDEHLRGRLIGLGLAPGASVSVASGGRGSPRVLTLRGCRVAIDDRCSSLVLVRPHLDAIEGPAGMKLREMTTGQRATITGYDAADPAYRGKLLAMGLTKGATLTLVRVAPLGDPVKVEIRGYALSLRKAEADALNVEPG